MDPDAARSNSDITVVIVTRNRSGSLARTLRKLRENADSASIIVVDNHSTDDTPSMVARDFPEVQLVSLTTNKGALARNAGVERANTPFVAFCDDDSWWEDGAIQRAVRYFREYPRVGLIAGKILVNDERRLDPTSALQSASPLAPRVSMPGPAILGFLGCGNVVRKQAYLDAGGYNRHIYFSGEEELLGIDLAAAGWGLTYCQDIVGRHYPSMARDVRGRNRMGARNAIQVTCMRRPWRRAISITLKLMIRYAFDRDKAVGVAWGVLRLPVALRSRRVVPDWLEDQIAQLEQQNEQIRRKCSRQQARS